MLSTKFQFIRESGFRGEFILEINQSEIRMACGGHVCEWIGTKWAIFKRTFHRCFLPSFGSSGEAVSEKKIYKNRPIRNKNCLWRPCLSMDRDKMSNLYREPSIYASYQISVHLGKRFQRRRFFRNQPIRNMNDLWWPCLLTDRDEMSNLYREPSSSIDATYQVSVHLA